MTQPAPPSETVLLVEDEDMVRNVVRTILQHHGYEVLEAASAPEAQRISDNHPGTIHLLISDLTLPQTNGPTLAAQLAVSRPQMKVLFLSGYAAEDATRVGLLEPDRPFLQKPFAATSLADKVREVL